MSEHSAVIKLLSELTYDLAKRTGEVANKVESDKSFESLRLANLSLLEAANYLQNASCWEATHTLPD
jgi:hypothetical protein